jgi:hypothetical protein
MNASVSRTIHNAALTHLQEAKSDSDAGPPLPKPSEDSITARPTTSTAARTAEAAQLEAELHALLANGTDDQVSYF